jgi:hypothetical protein
MNKPQISQINKSIVVLPVDKQPIKQHYISWINEGRNKMNRCGFAVLTYYARIVEFIKAPYGEGDKITVGGRETEVLDIRVDRLHNISDKEIQEMGFTGATPHWDEELCPHETDRKSEFIANFEIEYPEFKDGNPWVWIIKAD